ncbi:MAG TPA: hypothetical protein VNZ58_04910 [Thermomicrobiales bacterium]|nr:hypothetical protein [Thermomicrobiales bacterium]
MTQSVSRRTFVASSLALALSGSLVSRALAAQDATPAASGLDSLGLPTLNITISSSGFEGVPSSLPAGRYLVSATGNADVQEGLAVAFVQPKGMSVDDFLNAIKSGGPASPASGGGGGGGEGTPMSDEGESEGPPPAAFYDFLFAGGISLAPGQPNQVVLDLPAGDWVAWGDDPTSPLAPVTFTVTGEEPTDLPEPKANATISFSDFAINLTDGKLVSGKNIIKLENHGAQPHFLILMKGPDGMTKDDIKTALDVEMTGTPVAGSLSEKDLTPVLGTDTQSTGVNTWVAADLEPGTYAGLCFFPDKETGMPHAYMGMYNVFTVGS